MTNIVSWGLIDKLFKDNPYLLVNHHLESYNDFFNNGIYKIFKENNPVKFTEKNESNDEHGSEIQLFLGGKSGRRIYFGKPIIYDDEKSHFMYPNMARLRNLTYGMTIHYDVEVEFVYYDETDEKKEITTVLDKIFLGRFPIMLHSNMCVLKGLSKEVRFNMGECYHDNGGYFVISGKEKTIVPQEKFSDNMIYIRQYKDTEIVKAVYTLSAEVHSVSEDPSKPIRYTSVKLVAPSIKFTNKQIVVDVPNVRSPVPLFILMNIVY
jgi:DNA-directed RNA polymerase beta subunit